MTGDMPRGGWVDRFVVAGWRPYLRLMRLDRPIGVWLLLFPGWWSIALASRRWPDPRLIALFAIGAVVMRAAGCIVNDIADRKIDAQVARTAMRPIASGAISVKRALAFLVGLLAVGLLVLLQFNPTAIAVGAASLPLVAIYPFMKRVTSWPQAWLGLTFNWGALVGWAAVTGRLEAPALLLYAGGFFWTLGYDTIYAHQDKEDDALVGIGSTALLLGKATPTWLIGFFTLAIGLIALAGRTAGLSSHFLPILLLAAAQAIWQARTIDLDHPASCLARFRSNRYFGWLVLAAILGGKIL